MSYENFRKNVENMLRNSRTGITAYYNHSDDGRHYANLSDGTVIMGNTKASRVLVKWGSGHRAFVTF